MNRERDDEARNVTRLVRGYAPSGALRSRTRAAIPRRMTDWETRSGELRRLRMEKMLMLAEFAKIVRMSDLVAPRRPRSSADAAASRRASTSTFRSPTRSLP
jgi:hypothetical protein